MTTAAKLLALINDAEISDSQEAIFLDILEKRLHSLKSENDSLKKKNEELMKENKSLAKKYSDIELTCTGRLEGVYKSYKREEQSYHDKFKLLKKEILVSFEFENKTHKYQVISSIAGDERHTDLYLIKDASTSSKIGKTVKRKLPILSGI